MFILNSLQETLAWFCTTSPATLSAGVDYVVTEKAKDSANLPLLCTTKDLDREILVCDMGNPLPGRSMVCYAAE